MKRRVVGPSLVIKTAAWLFLAIGAGIWSGTSANAQNLGTVGQWSQVKLSAEAIHMQVLPNGKVMYWNRLTFNGRAVTTPFLWDPASGTNTAAASVPFDIFCGAHSFLPNGKLFVAGGAIAVFEGYDGAATYDPIADTWTVLPDMNKGRYYPTSTTLPTGDVLVTSGDDETGIRDNLPQVWQTNNGSWRDLSNAQLILDLYPRMLVAPNGQVFQAGPEQMSRYLDTSGKGAWTVVGNLNFGARSNGPAVMYNDGKVLVVGGGDPPTATAEVIDLSLSSPGWHYTGSMSIARRQHNAVLLPDGTVLVIGGSSGAGFDNSTSPVFPAELWDPSTGSWSTLASMTVYRGYHSTAVLLPDGRVLSAGGDAARTLVGEVFSPPYLFKGDRPTISSAPASVTYGETFFVETPSAADITMVTWIRLPATTHTFDENQRINRLNFSPAPGGLSLTAPSSANLAPPGHYMLFLLNSLGIPSVAKIVQLAASGSPGVSLSTNSLSFGDQSINLASPAQALTLTNPGTNNLNISALATSGDFAQTNTCAPAVAPGASCTVRVTFTPTAAGTRTGSITITDDAAGSPQTVSLTGVGAARPLATLSTASLTFRVQPVGFASGKKTVTLTNTGTATLNIASIAASGDFSQQNTCGASVAPAAGCTISVTFKPTAAGSRTGAVTITDDATDSPQTVSLSGMGTNVKLQPSALTFAAQTVGTTSAAQTLTVTNVGSAALTISGISISGGSSTDFAQTNTCGASLAAGASCAIRVTFTPSATGSRGAAVNIACSDPASPRKAGVSGTGQ